jgi:hypothetical protein
VTTVIVDARHARTWRALLRPLAPPRAIGGVLLYRFDRRASC